MNSDNIGVYEIVYFMVIYMTPEWETEGVIWRCGWAF